MSQSSHLGSLRLCGNSPLRSFGLVLLYLPWLLHCFLHLPPKRFIKLFLQHNGEIYMRVHQQIQNQNNAARSQICKLSQSLKLNTTIFLSGRKKKYKLQLMFGRQISHLLYQLPLMLHGAAQVHGEFLVVRVRLISTLALLAHPIHRFGTHQHLLTL